MLKKVGIFCGDCVGPVQKINDLAGSGLIALIFFTGRTVNGENTKGPARAEHLVFAPGRAKISFVRVGPGLGVEISALVYLYVLLLSNSG